MFWVLLAASGVLVVADVTIDLSRAALDPDTGNFCVTQKVGSRHSAVSG